MKKPIQTCIYYFGWLIFGFWAIGLMYYWFHNKSISQENEFHIRGKPAKALSSAKSHYGELTDMSVKDELGRSTWALLHIMASRYPVLPSRSHKKDILQFITILGRLYPCGQCSQHFQKMIKENPPDVSSHDGFKGWMCRIHNIVNKRLGKPIFECTLLDERWKCGCDEIET